LDLKRALAVATIGSLAFSASCASHGGTLAERSPTPTASDRAEIVRVAERLFEGMRTRDTALLRSIVAPDLVIVAARGDSSRMTIRSQSAADFLRAVATSAVELRERLWEPQVHVDGAIATLWAPYDFHLGERFSHCGHDAFQLARGERGWYVTGLTYTVRTIGCTGPPPREDG
jgi:hypothetical protein